MKRVFLISMSLALLVIAGCMDVGFKKTKSGLMYKIMSQGDNPPLKKGDWMKIHVRQMNNDSLIEETYGKAAIYVPHDSFPPRYTPNEVFTFLRNGDSAVVVMPGDSIRAKHGQLPEFMKAKDKYIVTFKVIKVFHSDSAKDADAALERSDAMARDAKANEGKKAATMKEIEDYLAEKKINYTKAAGGTYVVVNEPGTDPKADTGFIASVKYRGTFFKTDEVFDQNMDGSKPPYPVAIGSSGVVRGWEEGLPYFGKGGKGQLYVPFWTGYGSGRPKPFATMVFDIEIADVQPASAQPAPGVPPPGRR
jgi:FKBP-type peptidyl-prolyl cis-trans isomerase FkpA